MSIPPDWDKMSFDRLANVLNEGHRATMATTAAEISQRGNGKELPLTLDDFHAYMPMHSYIFAPTREMWPATSVNSRVPPCKVEDKTVPATYWLDRHHAVEQMTWAPGLPMLIEGRLVADGGWIERPGVTCFNLYRPPSVADGDEADVQPWLDLFHKVYPDDARHMINWLAQRVQRPENKINHALVMGGTQGIGKDTLLTPVKYAVGPWNFTEVTPVQLLGRFNSFAKSVVMRISEARDLGDINRYQFYEHMKIYAASPPEVLRVDEKHIREHSAFNCCGVVITTNNKASGLYLPPEDRRHYVGWSELEQKDFQENYWNQIWQWYANGGIENVASYLAQLDISEFDPKAPPPKTAAFWTIVDANRAPEDSEMADLIDAMGNPVAFTLKDVTDRAGESDFGLWLKDRKNRRSLPHRFEQCGYVPVRNPDAKDSYWKIGAHRHAVYALANLPLREQITAARAL